MPVPACEVNFFPNTLRVTFDNGYTYALQLSQVNDVTMEESHPMNMPYAKQFDFPNPTQTVGDFFPGITKWIINIHLNDGRMVSIPMGAVTNRAAWTNTQDGAVAAQQDVYDWWGGQGTGS